MQLKKWLVFSTTALAIVFAANGAEATAERKVHGGDVGGTTNFNKGIKNDGAAHEIEVKAKADTEIPSAKTEQLDPAMKFFNDVSGLGTNEVTAKGVIETRMAQDGGHSVRLKGVVGGKKGHGDNKWEFTAKLNTMKFDLKSIGGDSEFTRMNTNQRATFLFYLSKSNEIKSGLEGNRYLSIEPNDGNLEINYDLRSDAYDVIKAAGKNGKKINFNLKSNEVEKSL